MSIIDIPTLLAAISPETPCGKNLEYEPAFGALERAVQGKPEQEMGDAVIPAEPPNWQEAQARALELFSRTKDLRVAVHLTSALLRIQGLPGLQDGLAVVRGLVEQYWSCVYPQLDADDDDDPSFRVNTLMALADSSTILTALRGAPLVQAPGLGDFSWRDMASITGGLSSGNDVHKGQADKLTIEAAFMGCELSKLQETLAAISDSADHTEAIEKFIAQQIPTAGVALNLESLSGLLRSMRRLLAEKLQQRQPPIGPQTEIQYPSGPVVEDGDKSQPPTPSPLPQTVPQVITNRDEVIRVLDMVCDYFDRYEPSSPVPLLLQRAKRLVSKNFMEILQDLSPESLSQVEMIRGKDQGSS